MAAVFLKITDYSAFITLVDAITVHQGKKGRPRNMWAVVLKKKEKLQTNI